MRFKAIIILIFVIFWGGRVFADTLVLKSGKEIQGDILEKTDDYVKIDHQGAPLYFENRYVSSIIKDDPGDIEAAKSQDSGSPEGTEGAVSPEVATIFVKRGLELASQGKFEEARKIFNKGHKADSADPNFQGALNILDDLSQGKLSQDFALSLFKGSYCLERKDYSQAAANLEEALRVKPGDPDVSYNLAIAYQNMNKEEEAIKCLNSVIELNPHDAQAYSLLGTIYYSNGDYVKAREYFTLAQGIYKKNGSDDKAEEINEILEEF